MFNSRKKITFVKSKLGSRQKYVSFVKRYKLTKEMKDLLLYASITVKKDKLNMEIIDAAYEMIMSLEDVMTTDDTNSQGSKVSISQKIMYKIYSSLGFSYFSYNDGQKILNSIYHTKVQSPYDPTKTVLLIDVLVNTSMDAKAIEAVFHSYGIEYSKDAIDITGNNTLEYMLYHGEIFHYKAQGINLSIDDTGPVEVVPDILPIIPKSHLDLMQNLIQNQNESYSSFLGHATEFTVLREFQSAGYQADIPTASNTKGYDLLVEHKFFKEHGLIYNEHPMKPGFGMLQVKSTSTLDPTQNFTGNTLEHFQKFPDIPVIASSKIADNLQLSISSTKIIGFDKIGIDELAAEKMIYAQLQAVKDLQGQAYFDSLNIPKGLHISRPELDSIKDASELFGDVGFNSIPLLGIALSASFASYTNFKKINSKEITLSEGLKNIAKASGKTAIIGTASIAATQAIMGIFGTTSGSVLMGGYETVHEHFVNPDLDWDMSDYEDMAELAAVVALVTVIGIGMKKLWHSIVGDPFDKYREMEKEALFIEKKFVKISNNSKQKVLTLLGIDYVNTLESQINSTEVKMKQYHKKYTFGTDGTQSLQYYLNDYKKKFLSKSLEQFSFVIDFKKMLKKVSKMQGLLNRIEKDEDAYDKKELTDTLLSYYKSTNSVMYASIKKMLANAGKKKENVITVCRTILANEIKNQADLYKELLKGNDDLILLYNISDVYINLKNDMKVEIKKLKAKGHIKS